MFSLAYNTKSCFQLPLDSLKFLSSVCIFTKIAFTITINYNFKFKFNNKLKFPCIIMIAFTKSFVTIFMDSFSVTVTLYMCMATEVFLLLMRIQVHSLTKLDSLGKGKLFTEVYCAEEKTNIKYC